MTTMINRRTILKQDSVKLDDWQIAFISSINGRISTKLSTIIDFLFGGAISSVNDVKLKNKRKNEPSKFE